MRSKDGRQRPLLLVVRLKRLLRHHRLFLKLKSNLNGTSVFWPQRQFPTSEVNWRIFIVNTIGDSLFRLFMKSCNYRSTLSCRSKDTQTCGLVTLSKTVEAGDLRLYLRWRYVSWPPIHRFLIFSHFGLNLVRNHILILMWSSCVKTTLANRLVFGGS